ncbi:MAG: hypothetical protein KAJ37_13835, partial [Candidatus Krumholzibacteria bacterium]|nr:hypothetical protein [Candidatus Krumholzibacteria bacterium]
MANDIASRVNSQPLSLYVCSADGQRRERNLFAFALARSVIDRIPNTIVVDCDFLELGLTGLVPLPDAIGFLDQILYGSSLATITQSTEQGVTVIGAGSFVVSKRTPFLMEAFDDAARYLRQAAGCVIFCGPVLSEDGGVNPIVGHVDIPVLIGGQSSAGAGQLHATEQTVASAAGSIAWSVRISEPGATPVTLSGPDADGVMDLSASVDEILERDTPVREEAPVAPAPSGQEEDDELEAEVSRVIDVPFEEEGPGEVVEGKSWDSVFPKIVTTALAVFLIGFLLWWLYLTKATREEVDRPVDIVESVSGLDGEQTRPGGESPVALDGTSGRDANVDTVTIAHGLQRKPASEAERVVEGQTTTPPVERERVAEGQTTTPPVSVKEAGEMSSASAPADLEDYAGKYLVHVSSFRGAARVEDGSDYLTARGYHIVVTRV